MPENLVDLIQRLPPASYDSAAVPEKKEAERVKEVRVAAAKVLPPKS